MGYCYEGGLLCCDVCGGAGGVRKARCPHGYCPSVACCGRAGCKSELANSRKIRCAVECKRLSAEMKATEARKAEALAGGAYLRRAAVGVDGFKRCVRVWFINADRAEQVLYMSTETYRALDDEDVATPDDYRARGEVAAEPKNFA